MLVINTILCRLERCMVIIMVLVLLGGFTVFYFGPEYVHVQQYQQHKPKSVAADGHWTGELQENNSTVPTIGTGLDDLKVLLYITTHFSENHKNYFRQLWPAAMNSSRLLQHADIFIFATGPTWNPWVEGTNNSTMMMEVIFPFHYPRIHEEPNPGYQEGAVLALKRADERGWFRGYDWVVRLNPDVIILNDTEIINFMIDPNIDGIFVNCHYDMNNIMIHTDWSAFRPSAVKDHAFVDDKETRAENAFTSVMQPILESKKFVWLPRSKPRMDGYCKVNGDIVFHYEP